MSIDNNNNNNNQPNVPDINIPALSSRKRGKYCVVNPQHKLLIAKEAARSNIRAAIESHPRLALKYSSVAMWKVRYERAKTKYGTATYSYSVCIYS